MEIIKIILMGIILAGFSCAPFSNSRYYKNQGSGANDIRYKACDSLTNAKAMEKLLTVLQDTLKSGVKWFDKGVGCGPFLWMQLSKNDFFIKADGAKIFINAPFSKGTQSFEGKSFRNPADLDSLQSFMVELLKKDGQFIIRKPNPLELRIYWSLIPYDIEEPIFVIETKSHRILVHFLNEHVFQIDDYYGVDFKAK
jgi:hypothetical protein